MVEARFYWRTTHRFGVRAFILAHNTTSTATLYEMAQRYHENCPPAMRPHTGNSNAKELIFDKLDSGYRLGTAGTDDIGRSMNLQYFHGSEVAFWPERSASNLSKGIMQAIGDVDETEIILESTGNGIGGYFHGEAMKAVRGEGDFRLVFIPWYWEPDYRRPVPKDFQRTDEEEEFVAQHGLDDEQLAWRRHKIIELTTATQNGVKAFRQEYPFTLNEAFQSTMDDGLIKPETVQKCRGAEAPRGDILIVGVDPSRGGDRFSVIRRRSRTMYGLESYTGEGGEIKLGRAVQICKKILDEEKPDRMFIDYGGGADLVDRLHELGYEDIVRAVHFGGSPFNPEKYRNKRAEMWGELADWMDDEELPASIPDSDSLEADLVAPKCWRDSSDRICLQPKDEMETSPDEGDAAALTFAEPVRRYTRKKLPKRKTSIA